MSIESSTELPNAENSPQRYILLPGRHHLFTRFQWQELRRIVAGQALDLDGEAVPGGGVIIAAITSADHSNTLRNPVPAELRAAQAHLAAAQEDLDCITISIPDVGRTDRFAEYIVGAVEAEESVSDRQTAAPIRLTPDNCVVACSTPSVVRQFDQLGFAVTAMEHNGDPRLGPTEGSDLWHTTRPWQLIEASCLSGPDGQSSLWVEHAHPATDRLWDLHQLADRVRRLHAGALVGEDSDLTSGRDYFTYIDSFDRGADRKWQLLADDVSPGRILDIGCAAGAMLTLAGDDPRLGESDLLGVELSRALYDECLHRKRMGAFANPNTFFFHRDAMQPLFHPRSINTTMTVSLAHEIVSYIDEAALDQMSRNIYDHTAPDGVWLIYDVCAPQDQDRLVRMTLDDTSGIAAIDAAATDHGSLSVEELGPWLDSLSVRARFDVFAATFRLEQGESLDQVGSVVPNADGSVDLRLGDAMDFLAHHTYTESWRSEMNERFSYRSLNDWVDALSGLGFEVEPTSRTWTNPWLAEHRFAPVASLMDPSTGAAVDWGETNVVVVARRP